MKIELYKLSKISVPNRRFCKRFVEKGTSRQLVTVRVSGGFKVVPPQKVPVDPSSGKNVCLIFANL